MSSHDRTRLLLSLLPVLQMRCIRYFDNDFDTTLAQLARSRNEINLANLFMKTDKNAFSPYLAAAGLNLIVKFHLQSARSEPLGFLIQKNIEALVESLNTDKFTYPTGINSIASLLSNFEIIIPTSTIDINILYQLIPALLTFLTKRIRGTSCKTISPYKIARHRRMLYSYLEWLIKTEMYLTPSVELSEAIINSIIECNKEMSFALFKHLALMQHSGEKSREKSAELIALLVNKINQKDKQRKIINLIRDKRVLQLVQFSLAAQSLAER